MKGSFHIDAPVKTVFDFFFDSFKDPAKLADLTPMSARYDDVKATKDGVGTYMSWRTEIAGLPVMRGFDVITNVVPNKHITERSSNVMVGTWDYNFEAEGSGTKVTLEHRSGSFWGIPPLRNLVDVVTGRLSASFMARVKDTIETQGK